MEIWIGLILIVIGIILIVIGFYLQRKEEKDPMVSEAEIVYDESDGGTKIVCGLCGEDLHDFQKECSYCGEENMYDHL